MARKRRKFTREFKESAVRMITEGGHRQSEVARDLEIRPDLLRRWARELEAEGVLAFPGEGNPKDKELAELRRELARVKEERDILKKAVLIFSDEPKP